MLNFAYFNCLIKILFIIITFVTRSNYHQSLKKQQIQLVVSFNYVASGTFSVFLNQQIFLIVIFQSFSYRISSADKKSVFHFLDSLRIFFKKFYCVYPFILFSLIFHFFKNIKRLKVKKSSNYIVSI